MNAKTCPWIREEAQQAKRHSFLQSEDLGFVPEPIVEGEKQLINVVPRPPHACCSSCVSSHPHIIILNMNLKKFDLSYPH